MSTLAFSTRSSFARKHAARQPARHLTNTTPRIVAPADLRDTTVATPSPGRGWILLGLVAVLIHAGVLWQIKHASTEPLPVATAPKPLQIELAHPLPEAPTQPPVPLKMAPPPPQKVVRPIQRAPVPAPAPREAPTPVEQAAPTDVVQPAPPPAPPAPAPAPVVEKVTEAFGHAGYLSNPPPEYPSLAQREGWEGKVLLRVRVLADGHPDSVEVQQTSGRKVLDQAAIKTVKGWLFMPAKRGTTPIDGWATVPIDFKLAQ